MNEKWMCNDPASRVRALVATAVTSGAFLSGALMAAAPAFAECTTADANCTTSSNTQPSGVPSQRERNDADVNYLLARGEFVRLQGVEEQARRERDEALKNSGGNMDDPRFAEKYRVWNDAQLALKAADEKATAASNIVTQLEKRVTDAAANAAAAQRAEEDRVAVKWGGPTKAELDDAYNKTDAAQKESRRLKDIYESWHQKIHETAEAYFAGKYPKSERSKIEWGENDAFWAWKAAEDKAEAARAAQRALMDRADEAVKKREAQEAKDAAAEEAEFRSLANWGGVSHAQFEEANNRTLALQNEGIRLQAIVDKAQDEAWAARQAYGMNDPRYLEKQRIFDEAVQANTVVYHQEWESGNFYQSLVEKNKAAQARQAEDAEARRQEARNIYGPPAEEVDEAKARMKSAQEAAAPLQVSADKANQELTDAQQAYGADDPRTKEKQRAFDDAVNKLGGANQTELEARKHYEDLVAQVNRADKRRAAREEAERQAAKEAAAADPEAAKKKEEADKLAAERDRLSAKAAKAWLELKFASDMYGPGSKNPRYQERLKAYEEASKLLEPFAEKSDPEPSKDETAPSPTPPANSDNADQKKESSEEAKTTPAETKPTDSKPAESDASGSASSESKPAETKPGESKPDESKPAESKPDETKPSETKPGETKPAESKPDESKPAETKPTESTSAKTKPAETKPSDSKADQKPADSKPAE
ncbi:hypothetical protein MMAD_04430 [Mycolicibacterium madagascariense]|uniref:Uncharacterized protein n=1 Tax=Mycolicibacterium madagascariense TaxID=212765 RepID=A0A7I7XCN5_9MYCO|nr:hypothetical protein [Mycolicibacterium madagascariense]MCV7012901.1 hypothetical protein [Mycolicibacterium madagascariense]BBZ26148.1 hypothetical protein MMAD_04430 [Mycolicibacterium madagascariense]